MANLEANLKLPSAESVEHMRKTRKDESVTNFVELFLQKKKNKFFSFFLSFSSFFFLFFSSFFFFDHASSIGFCACVEFFFWISFMHEKNLFLVRLPGGAFIGEWNAVRQGWGGTLPETVSWRGLSIMHLRNRFVMEYYSFVLLCLILSFFFVLGDVGSPVPTRAATSGVSRLFRPGFVQWEYQESLGRDERSGGGGGQLQRRSGHQAGLRGAAPPPQSVPIGPAPPYRVQRSWRLANGRLALWTSRAECAVDSHLFGDNCQSQRGVLVFLHG